MSKTLGTYWLTLRIFSVFFLPGPYSWIAVNGGGGNDGRCPGGCVTAVVVAKTAVEAKGRTAVEVEALGWRLQR